mgnify:CR=1 FL=1
MGNSAKQTYTQLMEWLETVKRPKKTTTPPININKISSSISARLRRGSHQQGHPCCVNNIPTQAQL